MDEPITDKKYPYIHIFKKIGGQTELIEDDGDDQSDGDLSETEEPQEPDGDETGVEYGN